MEKQIVTITVKTEGEPCEMTDEQVREWYAAAVAGLFDPRYGTPEIGVEVTRIKES